MSKSEMRFYAKRDTTPSPRKKELEDLDPMPFGLHRGVKMQDVPADYLHHLWTYCDFKNKLKTNNVARYIERNVTALKKEFPDGIWT